MAVQQGSERSKLIGVVGRALDRDGAPRAATDTAEPTAPAPPASRPKSRDSGVRAAAKAPSQNRLGAASAEAKIELLEAMLLAEDVADCAQRAVAWICERGRVKHAICAVVEPDQARLVGVAGFGLSDGAVKEFCVELEDLDDPLVAVLSGSEPVTFRRNAGRDHPWTPFGSASFVAFPLGRGLGASARLTSEGRELRPGLLITNPPSSLVAQDIRWAAGLLGPQIARLSDQNAPARAHELDLKVRAATAALIQQNEILNQQNELLNQQRLALEQASSAKSQFLANMSHEFRTPLNAILGYTSMLLQGMGGELNPQQAQMLSRVDSNGRNLLSLINDILDISRIEAGKMPVHFAEFRVDEIIPELLGELEPMITRSKLAVATELEEVPVLRSDRQKVKQILLNLITNALKFTPKGSVTITTAYEPTLRQITASVIDTGIGIAEADQKKLFSDFQQADSSPSRQYGGAGLGLSICRRLAAMLGGHITLASKLGQGSTFTLVLPRQARHR